MAATIIKKADATGSTTRVPPVAFRLRDEIDHSYTDRADDCLSTVRDQAATIIAEAHQQAERIRRQAEEAGRQAARNAIERILDKKISGQLETLMPAVERLVAQLEDARGAWHDHWEYSAIRLATAIAERIIRREIRQHPKIPLEIIREGLELAAGAAEIAVHLHPTDHITLGELAQRLAESLERVAHTEIVADPNISPGGCRVVTKFGEIDMQIESQLQRIEEELR